jgi:hypothetical protein
MTRQILLTTFVILASALWSTANSQLPPGAGTGGRRDKSIEDKYRSDEMERVRREADRPKHRAESRFPQIKEDFERIQVINSDLLQVKNSDSGLNHSRISEASAEIRKRATRLKSNLFPTASSERVKEKEPLSAVQDLKSLLTELDKAITSFVHNPIFENTRVVNPQDSAKAERDLQKIINLSEKARKKAR